MSDEPMVGGVERGEDEALLRPRPRRFLLGVMLGGGAGATGSVMGESS